MKVPVLFTFFILLAIIPTVLAVDEDWTTLRADPRIEISFPSDWNWQEVPTGHTGMNGYFMVNKNLGGLYALVMAADNPVFQIPDKDLLDELIRSLIEDYPDYTQITETQYGSDEKRPQFSFSEWKNQVTGEKLTLIVAGSKKTLIYLWLVYPSELMEQLYRPVMNDIATSLTIF